MITWACFLYCLLPRWTTIETAECVNSLPFDEATEDMIDIEQQSFYCQTQFLDLRGGPHEDLMERGHAEFQKRLETIILPSTCRSGLDAGWGLDSKSRRLAGNSATGALALS
ncbi:hypothetical protein Esti_005790 [Eimeria stiedai]